MHESGLIQILLTRLERISADSYWAHRASGIRGSLLRAQSRLEAGRSHADPNVNHLVDLGFEILNRAAEEKVK
jgi:hypothetical protein